MEILFQTATTALNVSLLILQPYPGSSGYRNRWARSEGLPLHLLVRNTNVGKELVRVVPSSAVLCSEWFLSSASRPWPSMVAYRRVLQGNMTSNMAKLGTLSVQLLTGMAWNLCDCDQESNHCIQDKPTSAQPLPMIVPVAHWLAKCIHPRLDSLLLIP